MKPSVPGPRRPGASRHPPPWAAPPGGAAEARFPDFTGPPRDVLGPGLRARKGRGQGQRLPAGQQQQLLGCRGPRSGVGKQGTRPAPGRCSPPRRSQGLLGSSDLPARGALGPGVPEAAVTEVPRIRELLSWPRRGAGQPVRPFGPRRSDAPPASAAAGTSRFSRDLSGPPHHRSRGRSSRTAGSGCGSGRRR